MLPVRESNKFYQGLIRLTLSLRFSKICRHYSSKLTHYEVLGLTREASTEDIRAAYIKKSKECHPDMNSKDPTNHKQFISVNEAYTILSKPLSRISYDARLQPEQVHKKGTSHFNQPHYHYPDVEIQRVRDIKNRDRMQNFHKNTGGSTRDSNLKTVAGCVLLMFVGSILQFLAFKWSRTIHKEHMDARDAMARKQLLASKEHVNLLLQKQAADRASGFHVQENSIPSDG